MGVILNVPYIDQTGCGAFTGCESASAVMLLQYLGVPLSLEEFIDRFLDKAPLVKTPAGLFGPDPRKAFAGDPRDKDSFGCYAPVIRRSLSRALGEGFSVREEKDCDPDALCARFIDRGMPVVLWATIDMQESLPGPVWTLPDGRRFHWRSREHCLLLVGYDDDRYWFNDPWENHGLIAYDKALVRDRVRQMYGQAVSVSRRPV